MSDAEIEGVWEPRNVQRKDQLVRVERLHQRRLRNGGSVTVVEVQRWRNGRWRWSDRYIAASTFLKRYKRPEWWLAKERLKALSPDEYLAPQRRAEVAS